MTTGAVASRGGRKTGERQGERQGNGHRLHKSGGSTATMMGGDSVGEVNGEVNEVGEFGMGVPRDSHAEVRHDAAASGTEFAEAGPEELRMAGGDESAMNDLRGEGYEPPEPGEEPAGFGEAMGLIPDAGTTLTGGHEVAALAGLGAKVFPLLNSPAGPAIAQALQSRLSPRAQRILAKHGSGSGPTALLRTAMEHAGMQGEMAGVALDNELIDEVVQTAEVIIGTDDRLRITATTEVPWRRYCALKIEFRDGAIFRGTGFFIGERVLATAGHCVFAHDHGGFARRIEVIPGCNGTQRPFGSAVATTFRSTVGWTRDKLPAADYGAIILPPGAFPGQNFGSFGFGVFNNQTLLATEAVVAGYPGDKPFAELWGMGRKIKTVTPTNLIYDHDTMGGQSGAPVYIMIGGQRFAVGIHNYGAITGNSATRVTAAVVANFRIWSILGTEMLGGETRTPVGVGVHSDLYG